MNGNDLAIVVTGALLATAFVALFAARSPFSVRAFLLRRLLPGIAGIVALTALASWWLNGVAAADVAACQVQAARGLAYDCEDAYLVVVMAILAGAFSLVFFAVGLTGVFAVKRFRRAGVAS